jgi:hypothetical protein
VLQHAESFGFFLCCLEVFLLPDVDGDGYDFGAVLFLEPFYEDGCVESAAVREYDFLGYVALPLFLAGIFPLNFHAAFLNFATSL